MVHRPRFSVSASRPLRRPLLALAAACSFVPALAAGESPAERVVSDPVLAPMLRAPSPSAPLLQLTRPPADDEADRNPLLDIRLADGRIYNPATRRYDSVRLRGYIAAEAPENRSTPFVGPTLTAKPGQTIRIGLNNRLAPEPGCKPRDINIPHCFNSTNLHSHGLWVSPAGNSDNVLIAIRPNVSFEYEYNIPATHPAGTFWYHPHLHGSTALQVSSGMAGALIVRGERTPTPTRNGDVDTLLRDHTGAPFRERIVLLQQVQYACRDAQGRVKTKMVRDPQDPKKLKVVDWICDTGDIGGIDAYKGTAVNVDGSGSVPVGTTIEGYNLFGPSSWKESGRHTSINGGILATFEGAVAGRVERWRTIHAGVRDSINLQFVRMDASANPDRLRNPAEHDRWIAQYCKGAPLPQFEIASDGLTHARAIRRAQTLLQPGYRSDLLMVFPQAGRYCVIDGNVAAAGSISAAAESRRLLGVVTVAPGLPVGDDPTAYLKRMLVRSAYEWMPNDVKARVVGDLERDLGLGAFVPHRTIEASELTPNSGQHVEFSIGGDPTRFMVNGKPYDPNTARTLVLGHVEEWTLTSLTGGHPFHIHVNPFQIVSVMNPEKQEVGGADSTDPDYANTLNTWKDTLFVKEGYTIRVRTRYQRYIGEYVLHCHILDHEDQGMMQNVRVVLPDGEGGAMTGGHGHH
jgi:FtsP/CotA-like multicopper oxidase with cupredoxin domain